VDSGSGFQRVFSEIPIYLFPMLACNQWDKACFLRGPIELDEKMCRLHLLSTATSKRPKVSFYPAHIKERELWVPGGAVFSAVAGHRADMSRTHQMELSCEQTIRSWGVCEPALEAGGEWKGSRTRCQDFKPDLRNSAVRHYRGPRNTWP